MEGRALTFHKMYLFLFGAVEDAVCLLETGNAEAARQRLIAAQQAAEDMYVSEADNEDKTE